MKIIKKYYDKKQSGGECIILGESILLNWYDSLRNDFSENPLFSLHQEWKMTRDDDWSWWNDDTMIQ